MWHSLWTLGDYGRGMIGVLGWQDTRLPEPLFTGWTAGIGAAVALGLATIRRAWVPVLLLSAAVLLLPAVFQATSAHRFGYIWQGRYGLPVLVALVLVAVAVGGRTALRRTSPVPLTAVLWTAWGVAQVTAFLMAYHRYSVGVGGPWDVMWRGAGWQAPHGLSAVAHPGRRRVGRPRCGRAGGRLPAPGHRPARGRHDRAHRGC